MPGIFGSILGPIQSEVAGILRMISPVLILFGVGWGLFGYRIYRITLFIIGFLIGTLVGGAIGYAMSQSAGMIVGGLAVGVAFGFLAMFLAKVVVFLIGFAVGAVVGAILAGIGGSASAAIILGLILGIVGGIVALRVYKLFIVFSTSIAGAALVARYLPYVVWVHAERYVWVVVEIVLAIAFIVFQYINTRGVKYDISGRVLPADLQQDALYDSGPD